MCARNLREHLPTDHASYFFCLRNGIVFTDENSFARLVSYCFYSAVPHPLLGHGVCNVVLFAPSKQRNKAIHIRNIWQRMIFTYQYPFPAFATLGSYATSLLPRFCCGIRNALGFAPGKQCNEIGVHMSNIWTMVLIVKPILDILRLKHQKQRAP